VQGPLPGRKVHASLLDERGQVVGRGRPQYEDYAVDQLVSVKAEGAVGDGKTASVFHVRSGTSSWEQDDTAALQAVLDKVSVRMISELSVVLITHDQYAATKIIFIDHGTYAPFTVPATTAFISFRHRYYVTDTLRIPKNARLVGEVWSVLLGGGPRFGDADHPRVFVRVGEAGDEGRVEISDIIFATRGPGMWHDVSRSWD
jgi:glucan 1,3-beta-glucosidase